MVYLTSGRKWGRGEIHTEKCKKKEGRERKARRDENIFFARFRQRKYGMKENGNKTLALFPSSPLPLKSFNKFFLNFHVPNISLLFSFSLTSPEPIYFILLYPSCGLSSLSFHSIFLSSSLRQKFLLFTFHISLSQLGLLSPPYTLVCPNTTSGYHTFTTPCDFLVYRILCLD